ncbi:hypothetical protein VIGAN_05240900 [Vigna angularis var. angularis]|uniref:Uncharacterized protein n=1 Tax=Vigna angularis var. angularis TaxID=157739 RepID=A0A0S3S7H0_PHAAN|nr:hypothetical protein VIGAN_05240900 [Vigna angularis var. angularis]
MKLMKQGAMMTVLRSLLTALAWPGALLSATDFIDSKWTIAIDRCGLSSDAVYNRTLLGSGGEASSCFFCY